MAAICANFLLRAVVVNIAVAEGSWKISQGSGVHYKEGIMGKILASLFARRVPFLPDHYFAVRNPFNESDTLFRFNLSDGRLFLRGTLAHREDSNVCQFTRSRSPGGFCRLPIAGSFATYNCTLSYGRHVKDKFQIKVGTEEYAPEWNTPADVSMYFTITNFSKNALLVLDSVFVTEFVVKTTSSPPFKNFTVFNRFDYNATLILKVWVNFTDYVYRRCKQDMRTLIRLVYSKRMRMAAIRLGQIDSTKLLE